MTKTTQQATITALRTEAEAKHADYPQYKGHWDGWFLIDITHRVVGRLGTSFEKGDYALAKVDETRPDAFTAYSTRTGWDTLVPMTKAVRVLAPTRCISHHKPRPVPLKVGAFQV